MDSPNNSAYKSSSSQTTIVLCTQHSAWKQQFFDNNETDAFWTLRSSETVGLKSSALKSAVHYISIVQLNSTVLPWVDAYMCLASFFRGGKPDKPHLRGCDFYIVPTAKQHTFTKTSNSFISILAAKPDGVWLNGPAWPALYGEGLGFA